jgi:adenine-specific DNA-methyltransferase
MALPAWVAPLLQQPQISPQLYCAAAPLAHRRRFGQFFTPPHIAAWMADYVAQPHVAAALDPAVGTGVLAGALLDHPRLPRAAILRAYDRDPTMIAICRRNLAAAGARLQPIAGDFLAEPVDDRRYDAIVCNPPYLRHRVLHERRTLIPALAARFGLPLSIFSNSYVLFMLQIAAQLSARGRAAIITPVDYLNANFGRPIKAFLLRANLIDGLLLFDQTSLVFAEVNIAACVLLLRAARAADDPLTLAHVADDSQLQPLDRLPAASTARYLPAAMQPEQPWLPLFPGAQPASIAAPALLPRRRTLPLGELATVKRGIATGANEFFTLSAAECAAHGIAPHEVRPCLIKATHAPQLHVTAADVERLLLSDGKIYLLDLQAEPTPATARYLEHGRRLGIDRRYLPQQRKPWYSTEQRPSAPLLVTTFSRRGFRFTLNDAGIVNLTAFHCIYPHSLSRDELLALAAFLNSNAGAEALRQRQRIYGSGLHKLEPLDVAALQVPDVRDPPRSLLENMAQLYLDRCAAQRSDPERERTIAAQIDRLWAAYLAG